MNDNTKQAGDVKRYEMRAERHPMGFMPYVAFLEIASGDWVRYDDIAHLLKPQEPVDAPTKIGSSIYQERIEKLEAENKTYREALETIANTTRGATTREPIYLIATEALGSGEPKLSAY